MSRHTHRTYGTGRVGFPLDGIWWRKDGQIVLLTNQEITDEQYKRAARLAEEFLTIMDRSLKSEL